jgi:hypothetical protein
VGRPEDPMSVVDASIFLVSSCVNTNFSTLMSTEKIADAIIAGY